MNRCHWATTEAMKRYHDEEWGQRTTSTRHLFETLALEIFQGGLSWALILKRRAGMRQAMHQFYPENLADLSPANIEQLLADERVIRNRRKITAIIHNARIVATMTESFSHYLDRITAMTAPDEATFVKQVVKQMKADGFQYVGPSTINAFLEATGYLNHHEPDCDWYQANVTTPNVH